MAKSKVLTLKGKAYWAKCFEDNRDMIGAIDPDGQPYNPDIRDVMEGIYQISLEPDEESLEELQASGSKTVDFPRSTPEGTGDMYTFKKPHKKFDRKGNLLDWASGPPKVVYQGGRDWSFEDDGPIGNGSEVEVTIVVYGTGRFTGTRLEKINILNHVSVRPPEEKALEDSEVPF